MSMLSTEGYITNIQHSLYMDTNVKTCPVCKRELPHTNFYNAKNTKDKLSWNCKDCQREYHLNWESKNREKVRKRHSERTQRRRDLVFKLLDNFPPTCTKCGFTDRRALQLDHINGGGQRDREKYRGADQLYTYILSLGKENAKSEFQVLCANCNQIKKVENKELERA